MGFAAIMTTPDSSPNPLPPAAAIETTPAGLQASAELTWRRLLVAAHNVVTYLFMADWMADILGAGGWSIVDILMMLCFLVGLPWTVLGFWNAVIGLWLLKARTRRSPRPRLISRRRTAPMRSACAPRSS